MDRTDCQFLLILILPVLALMASALYIESGKQHMAHQTMNVVQAGGHYIRDNQNALEAQIKNGGKVTISGETLREKGYLPTGFSLDNRWYQHYQLMVMNNPKPPFQLVAFVLTTGGKDTTDDRDIARRISLPVKAGFTRAPDDLVVATDNSWRIVLKDYGISGQQAHLLAWVPAGMLPDGEKLPTTGL